jgi:hypothetical protein
MSAVSAALRHPGVRLIGGGWAFFITENVAISQNRDWIIQGIGTSNYYRMYVRCYAAIYHLSLATYWLDWLTQTTLDDACPREVLVLCLSACPFSGRAVCARQHCSRATCSGTAPCPRVRACPSSTATSGTAGSRARGCGVVAVPGRELGRRRCRLWGLWGCRNLRRLSRCRSLSVKPSR